MIILGNGAMPYGPRTSATFAILAVATVCVVMLCHDNTGDLKEETRPNKVGTPDLKLVQFPMILASDTDIRRAIAAKQHKMTEARKKSRERQSKAHAAKKKVQKQDGQAGMPASIKKFVNARNRRYEARQRQLKMRRKMAAALDNPHDDLYSDDMLLQMNTADFSDDVAKELSAFTSSSHAIASDLLYGDEAAAHKSEQKVEELEGAPKPAKRKRVVKKKKKKKVVVAKKARPTDEDADMEGNGPMAKFIAGMRAKEAMKSALGLAGKAATQSTLDDDDNLESE